jgi:hypothetical protein
MESWFEKLAAPAQRALTGIEVRSLDDISKHTFAEIAGLHGNRKKRVEGHQDELDSRGVEFRDEERIWRSMPISPPSTLPYASVSSNYGTSYGPGYRRRRSGWPTAIPTYSYGENVVHFAGFKGHIGFFPTPSGVAAFEEEMRMLSYFQGRRPI